MKSLYILICTTLLSGCGMKVGPHNLKIDSLSYNRAVQSSNDTQLLLNIVRLRYRDTPTFLQVGTVSTSYEWKRSLGAEFATNDANHVGLFEDNLFKVAADYSEKPTTVYQPVRGETFAKEFLSPVSFQALLLLNSSGWQVDRILRCCVQRMNGLRNAPNASGPTPYYAPDYQEFLELMAIFRDFEKRDGINIVVERNPTTDKKEIVFVIYPELVDKSQLQRAWQLLDIDPGTYHIRLSPFHGHTRARDEVLVDTRSPLSILYFLSQGVQVPYVDEVQGLVTVTVDSCGNRFDWENVLDGIIEIHSASPSTRKKEGECLARRGLSVRYRGIEFYIDDSDLDSKSTFVLLSQLMALQMSCPQVPALVLPIGG